MEAMKQYKNNISCDRILSVGRPLKGQDHIFLYNIGIKIEEEN